jgi:hypothetical protein
MASPPPLLLEQALFHRVDGAPPLLHGRSPGFRDEWARAAAQMICDFGVRPAGRPCPQALFALPLVAGQVAVVRVAEAAARADELAFHFLVIPRGDYEQYLGDPFELAERFPVAWHAPVLATLILPREPLPPRTLAQVRAVLRRVKAGALREDEDPEAPEFTRTAANSESPALLGGAQVLVDGGRLVFVRPADDLPLLAGLWALLPYGTRCRRWPASFAFGNRLGFDALVVAAYDAADFAGYTTEEQAADYPQGSYELALQTAAEAGDESELERVFERRGGADVLRRTLVLFALVVLIVLGGHLLNPLPPAPELRRLEAQAQRRAQAAVAAGIAAVADPWGALGLYYFGKARWHAARE